MIRKWYEYSCDMCGRGITHLTYKCVSKKEFENIGIILYDNNHFCCEECRDTYINKNKENKRKDYINDDLLIGGNGDETII